MAHRGISGNTHVVQLVTFPLIHANLTPGPDSPYLDVQLKEETTLMPTQVQAIGQAVCLTEHWHVGTWSCELGSGASTSRAWMQEIPQDNERQPSLQPPGSPQAKEARNLLQAHTFTPCTLFSWVPTLDNSVASPITFSLLCGGDTEQRGVTRVREWPM